MTPADTFDPGIFNDIVFSKGTAAALIGVCLILIAIPLVFLCVWKRRHKEQVRFRYFLAGAIGFLISARVLALGVHYFCILSDNAVSRFIMGNNAAYILYGIVMAGVFEECGRYLILKYVLKKDRTRENAVLYGIGHGGIEVLAVILPVYIGYLVILFAFTTKPLPEALAALNITEASAAAAYPAVAAVAGIRGVDLIFPVFERLMTMLVHIGLTVIVFHGVYCKKNRYLLFAVLLHMAVDTLPAMYQRGMISIVLCEGWLLIWALVIVFIARRLYLSDRDAGPEAAVSEA